MKVLTTHDGHDGVQAYGADEVIDTHASHAEMLFLLDRGVPRDDAAQGVFDLLTSQGRIGAGVNQTEGVGLNKRASKDGE